MNEKQQCSVCGEYFPEQDMIPYFTGRRKYACRACWARGDKESAARISIAQIIKKKQKNFEE